MPSHEPSTHCDARPRPSSWGGVRGEEQLLRCAASFASVVGELEGTGPVASDVHGGSSCPVRSESVDACDVARGRDTRRRLGSSSLATAAIEDDDDEDEVWRRFKGGSLVRSDAATAAESSTTAAAVVLCSCSA